MHRSSRLRSGGFTIIELLIVVVIIGVLAAITVVAFSNVQTRARDSERRSELSQMARVLGMYKVDKGGYPNTATGCPSGLNGSGSGWYNHEDGTATWPKSVMKCLTEAGYANATIVDPSKATYCANNDLTCHAYLINTCTAGTWLLVNMESIPQNSTFTDTMCGGSETWDTLYGVNYAIRID